MGKVIPFPYQPRSGARLACTEQGQVIPLPKRQWISLQKLAQILVSRGYWRIPEEERAPMRAKVSEEEEGMVTLVDTFPARKPPSRTSSAFGKKMLTMYRSIEAAKETSSTSGFTPRPTLCPESKTDAGSSRATS